MQVAINGTGVAGPPLAYWLLRAGHEVLLAEEALRLRGGGYVIDFWGAGFDIAEKMGLTPRLKALSLPKLSSFKGWIGDLRGWRCRKPIMRWNRDAGRRCILEKRRSGLAMAETYVLAGELRRTGDYAAASARYRALMMPFLPRKRRAAARCAPL